MTSPCAERRVATSEALAALLGRRVRLWSPGGDLRLRVRVLAARDREVRRERDADPVTAEPCKERWHRRKCAVRAGVGDVEARAIQSGLRRGVGGLGECRAVNEALRQDLLEPRRDGPNGGKIETDAIVTVDYTQLPDEELRRIAPGGADEK